MRQSELIKLAMSRLELYEDTPIPVYIAPRLIEQWAQELKIGVQILRYGIVCKYIVRIPSEWDKGPSCSASVGLKQ